MVMKQPFTTTQPILTNYDWTDLSGGTGYIRFLAAAATSSTAITYFLTKEVIDSYPISRIDLPAGTGTDTDFDIEFKDTSIIKGTAIINITRQIASSGASAVQGCTIKIYHVDIDTTETLLGTVIATSRTSTTSAIFRECLTIELAEKVFTSGQKLRLNVVMTKNISNGGFFFFDPASNLIKTDDLTRTVGTDLTCDIPFKINR